jgi:hypothetical protein
MQSVVSSSCNTVQSGINKKLLLLVFSFSLLVNSILLYPDIPIVRRLDFDMPSSEGDRALSQGKLYAYYHLNVIPLPPLYTQRSYDHVHLKCESYQSDLLLNKYKIS